MVRLREHRAAVHPAAATAVLPAAVLRIHRTAGCPVQKIFVLPLGLTELPMVRAADGDKVQGKERAGETKEEGGWLSGKLLFWQGCCLSLLR